MAAFRRALALGVTTLELDTGVTCDGVAVVGHDERPIPTSRATPPGSDDPPGPAVFALTRAELSYDVDGSSRALRTRRGSRAAAGRRATHADAGGGVRAGPDAAQHDRALQRRDQARRAPSRADRCPRGLRGRRDRGRARGQHDGSDHSPVLRLRTLRYAQKVAPDIQTVCPPSSSPATTTSRPESPPSPLLAGLDVDDYGGSCCVS